MNIPKIAYWPKQIFDWMHKGSSAGILLVMVTILALLGTNSPWSASFIDFWHMKLGLNIGTFQFEMSLHHLINDGLMTGFFFLVGLEIKREMVRGELREVRRALLPIAAAVGGMVVPALIYLLVLPSSLSEAKSGWGIPMATDIAFVVGFLALLGPRVPKSLKLFVLTLAIVDDIGAILVIALFYTAEISFLALGIAALLLVTVWVMQKALVRSIPLYLLVGFAVWICFLKAGIHPTIAGVILGLMTPAHPWEEQEKKVLRLTRFIGASDRHAIEPSALAELATASQKALIPLDVLEARLHPFILLGVMPLFALANAGIVIDADALLSPTAIAVFSGLWIGKPLGILLASAFVIRCGWSRLPTGVSWWSLAGAASLCGIGFTMSIFVAGLALPQHLLDAGKGGTLIASVASALLGLSFLTMTLQGAAPRSGRGLFRSRVKAKLK